MANQWISASKSTTWLQVVILSIIALVACASRLFSVIRFESIIHEFDPWFNYRATQQLVRHGFYAFVDWFDETAWYPLGRVVGGTVYPGIMVTSAVLHKLLHLLNFTIDIREVCVFLAPAFSGLTAFAAFLLTRELKDDAAGLLAAAFIGVCPGYISRSVAGSYDNEGIAIFLLLFTFYLWIKALKLGSAYWACLCALFYFYMVSAWGGYVFITNLLPLHAFALVLMGRFSSRLYISYCTFFAIGTLASMTIPFVGFQPTRTSEHMAALGIFGLLQLVAFTEFIRGHVGGEQFKLLLRALVIIVFSAMFAVLVALTLGGVIANWNGRFYSLWDTEYARKYIPIIASVSEHQPTAWTSFFYDLHMLTFLFPVGVYLCFKELRDEHVFVILYAMTASYFAGVMVRLMLTLTPIVCVAAAMSLSSLLDVYLKAPSAVQLPLSPTTRKKSVDPSQASQVSSFFGMHKTAQPIPSPLLRLSVTAMILSLLGLYTVHCTYVTQSAYSSPSVVLASNNPDGSQRIIDDFREAYYWLRENTVPEAKIMSWWDYGYQLAGFADRTTLVDNNTWNNTHIATVGKAMASNEQVAYEIMARHHVDYVLVIYGGVIGYGGDDINKFLWMIRIAAGVYPSDVKESDFFTSRGEYRVDNEASETMKQSLLYKMSYHRMSDLYGGRPFDRVRNVQLPESSPQLNVLEEAFSSENFIVRLYRVKKPDVFGRTLQQATAFEARHSSVSLE